MILFSVMIFIGILLFLFKLDLKKVFGLNIWFDIAITMVLTIVFAGTFSGVLIGLLVGAFVSVFLLVGRWFTTYQTPKITRHGVEWTTVTPPIPNAFARLRSRLSRKKATA
jgi:MFS superfamily sulfate permease-like transporter